MGREVFRVLNHEGLHIGTLVVPLRVGEGHVCAVLSQRGHAFAANAAHATSDEGGFGLDARAAVEDFGVRHQLI